MSDKKVTDMSVGKIKSETIKNMMADKRSIKDIDMMVTLIDFIAAAATRGKDEEIKRLENEITRRKVERIDEAFKAQTRLEKTVSATDSLRRVLKMELSMARGKTSAMKKDIKRLKGEVEVLALELNRACDV